MNVGGKNLTEKTILFDPTPILEMDGIDELDSMRATPNPYWNRGRLDITWNLAVMSGFLESGNIAVKPMRLATREELQLYHDPSYIETVELFGNMGSAFSSRFGLDTDECPVFYQMDRYASYPVGATVDAVLGVASGEYEDAMSFFGGFHHATESLASGFCYYNDVVVAIKKYKQMYPNKKVLYLDTDVHHGNGVQHAFYTDPDVLTIDLHELSMGFYPGTGRLTEIGAGKGKGYCVNIPLPPLTDDVEYWKAFEDLVVPIWLAYKPDFVLWEIGADGYYEDPLADLMLTYDTYHRLSMTVRQLVHLGKGNLVVVGGGGYSPVAAAKIWTIVLADLADTALPPVLPAKWIEMCRRYGYEVTRGYWTDRPRRSEHEHVKNIEKMVDDVIKEVKKTIFPILGIE